MQIQIPYKPLVSMLTGLNQLEVRITVECLHFILFVSLWVRRVFDCLNFFLNFVRRVQACSS